MHFNAHAKDLYVTACHNNKNKNHDKDLGFTALTLQEYFTYIELISNQRWAKTGVP